MQLLARVQLTRLPPYIVLRYIALHRTNHMEKIYPSLEKEKCTEKKKNLWARMNRQPPMHHPLEACDQYSVTPLLIYVRFLSGKLSYKG
jgi:hypothetical protein